MTGSVAAAWAIPIVAFLALFAWIGCVLWADAHPRYKHQSTLPRTEVAGGAFQALDGGRQLMPIPGDSNAWPDGRLVQPGEIPEQRTSMSEEELRAATGQQREQEATACETTGREPHLIPGSKLRLATASPEASCA